MKWSLTCDTKNLNFFGGRSAPGGKPATEKHGEVKTDGAEA